MLPGCPHLLKIGSQPVTVPRWITPGAFLRGIKYGIEPDRMVQYRFNLDNFFRVEFVPIRC